MAGGRRSKAGGGRESPPGAERGAGRAPSRPGGEPSPADHAELYRILYAEASDGLFVLGPELRVVDANPSFARKLGLTVDEVIGLHPWDWDAEITTREQALARWPELSRISETFTTRIRRRDGTIFDAEIRTNPVLLGGRPHLFHVCRDVSDRRRAEEALRAGEARMRGIVASAMDGIVTVDARQRVVQINPAAERMFGRTAAELLGQPLDELIPERLRERHREHVAAFGSTGVTSRAMGELGALTGLRGDGSEFPIEASISQVEVGGEKLFTVILREITERLRAEVQIERQLQRLSALRAIDDAINASLDIRVTLGIVLEQVTAQLGVDAAAVLLYNDSLNELEFAAGRGFRRGALSELRLRMGEGFEGRAALERRTVSVPHLPPGGRPATKTEEQAGERFAAFHVVPLVAKGQIKGILAVFHRSALDPDAEWMGFLETLAGQTAISIDGAELFQRLQRSHAELMLAYDATIEGWSAALDLRDKETEGHTLRVTETTVRLARAMGVGDAELVHVRRGALLHDIGKMGVPDPILLKPGPLTEEEWALMRRHPEHAYQLLSPIYFLRPALDIPYCHHEKWDGTGYPRGLAGEQIPLAARIFAVVDVWDALRSDRPYRSGWPQEKVLDFLRQESGQQFDPRAVDAFLRLLAADRPVR